jgi:hypothetical protein
MKHVYPEQLIDIWIKLKSLNVNFGFQPNSRPFVAGEVINFGVLGNEYYSFGIVTEFWYGRTLTQAFRRQESLDGLKNLGFGDERALHPSERALSFIDSHASVIISLN